MTALGAALPGNTLRAFAQPPAAPRRLIVISHCHGWPYSGWKMRASGQSEDEPWGLDQIVAARTARADRLPSLELSVDAALEAGRPIADNLSGRRLPAENAPLGAWERVFGPADYVQYHAGQVARLVSTLEAMPDIGGGSMMDNTLIVWGSELGDGWHGYSRYCPVLIGGSWAFNTGRYLYWPHRTPAEMRVPSQILASGNTRMSGIPHQHLLVSVARAMGLDVNHVGLEHVRGQRGDFIDVSGPLAGLTA